MEQNQEQAAGEMKAAAIRQMKRRDYEGAWVSLNRAKQYHPALQNLDIMLFVCNILRLADAKKPGYGVNWLEVLHLPVSANIETIQSQLKHFIYCIETIKTEFPGTALALRFLRDAGRDICSRENSKLVNLPSNVDGMSSANHGANKESCGAVKRKMPTSDCPSERDSRNPSSLRKCERLSNAKYAPEQVVAGFDCHGMDDTYHESRSEVSDCEIKNDELDPADEHHGMKPKSQISGSVGSKMVGAEVDDGVSRCQSNNDEDSENQIAEVEKKQSLSSDMKLSIFEACPQNPHYDPLNDFSREFCNPIILGIESSFSIVAAQIRSLVTEEDVKRDISHIRNQLRFLETMGYDVYKMQLRVAELGRLVDEKEAVNVACKEKNDELKDWKNKSRELEKEKCVIRSLIAHIEQEIQNLKYNLEARQSTIDSQNEKVAVIEEQFRKRAEECRWLDAQIEFTAKSPW